MITHLFVAVLFLCSFDLSLGQRKAHKEDRAEIKTGINFNCPEEFGYYPHPDDCTQYYVCVFGGALLESCTGGLMYSHELQTCDWPRNVGCDGLEAVSQPVSQTSNNQRENVREKDEYRTKYTLPPPPKPSAVVISRGQPRQHHINQQLIKKQPLYENIEEELPEAEEVENDRQQRFYRGQPSTIGQVQRDRDGLRHSNALNYNTSPKEKIGVISIGLHNTPKSSVPEYSIESSTAFPSRQTVTQRTAYNSSQYSSSPYQYAVYDDRVKYDYKESDYDHTQASVSPSVSFRRTPTPTYSTAVQEDIEIPKRNSILANDYNRDVYPQAIENYHNVGYEQVEEEPISYRQPQREQIRGSHNRGRGSTQYSAGNVATNEVTVNVNRGTPPPRSRPTLRPSTSIVSKAQEYVDIYRFPPRRPEPIYPQPQPDKAAAKCRKDVCLLPDCSCGGKEIPGDLNVEQVPQIVLLTFDDSVNDLNKGLYSDLFEKGRVNPNGCPISATFYVSHEWTDYSQVQNLYSDGHEIASHTVSHSFGEQFSQKKWTREVAGQREILSAYGGVKLEDVRGMRAPFLSVGGNKMFKMLYDSNFTYDSSMPIYENKPPSWPYTLDYKLFHDCMIPPCPTRSYPGVWEVPMVMWQDLNGGRCSMGDACSNPPESEGVYKMIMKNFQRHYTTNRAPFGLFYHAAWFTQPHHKEGFINFLDAILTMKDVWVLTNWQAVQWVRDPTPISRLGSFQPFQCEYSDRPKRCNNPKVCNLWHKSGVRYMRTCQPCPDIYPWTGNSGIRSSRIDNEIEE